MQFLRTLLPFMAASFAVAGVVPISLVVKDLAGRQGVDPSTIVAALQALAAQANGLEQTIETASGLSTPAQVSALSQNVTSTLTLLSAEVEQGAGGLNGVVFPDPACTEIGDALNRLAVAFHGAFQALISEAPVFVSSSSAAPIQQELEVILPSVDTLGNVALQALPCQAQMVKEGQELLDSDISNAIAALA